MFPSWVMILKLSKRCIFSILYWPQQKKLSMLKQFTYMHLKGLVKRFQKMLLLTMLTDISVSNRKTLLNFCWVSIAFDILIGNISWAVAQSLINNIIFWKTVIRYFRSIYVNCFHILRFLAEVGAKLQKMHFFGQYKDHNSGRKHGI